MPPLALSWPLVHWEGLLARNGLVDAPIDGHLRAFTNREVEGKVEMDGRDEPHARRVAPVECALQVFDHSVQFVAAQSQHAIAAPRSQLQPIRRAGATADGTDSAMIQVSRSSRS